ncbi:auxin-responsive protein IAA1-like [Iris pallida]|uniref:Auxin-responsive protein n=1 Tax=Iris pallida TaxID=29817 RepID=A0AAX6F315_IRIPA|nr:auxin-responsive protein IAA1-like [Iris pallida]
MSTTETGRSSTESEVSGLDYEDTVLTLGLPGGGSGSCRAEPDRKRGFELSLGGSVGGDVTTETDAGRSSAADKPPAAKAQVVGWPPVRSFRKNTLKSCTYVKVAVDGAPYLRKVDLETYGGYQQLLAALEEMFSCFKIRNCSNERRLVDPVTGTEYVPTYKDKDGDWMLVGDVPWKMFVASCKRLRLMKSSEAVNLGTIKVSHFIFMSFIISLSEFNFDMAETDFQLLPSL